MTGLLLRLSDVFVGCLERLRIVEELVLGLNGLLDCFALIYEIFQVVDLRLLSSLYFLCLVVQRPICVQYILGHRVL